MIGITGASGFVGHALTRFLGAKGVAFRSIARQDYADPAAFAGCEAVIHLAGLAHRRTSTAQEYLKANRDLPLAAACAAHAAGVKRFVFVSSSKALRTCSHETALSEDSEARPQCDYGKSKRAGEQALLAMSRESTLEVVIVRPALIVGAPPKANVARLARLAAQAHAGLAQWALRCFPARRSVTSLDNLCAALLLVCRHPAAANQIFHVVEDRPVSAHEMLGVMRSHAHGAAAGKLLPAVDAPGSRPGGFPGRLMGGLASTALIMLGQRHVHEALALPLILSGDKIRHRLDWNPPHQLEAELQRIMTMDK